MVSKWTKWSGWNEGLTDVTDEFDIFFLELDYGNGVRETDRVARHEFADSLVDASQSVSEPLRKDYEGEDRGMHT